MNYEELLQKPLFNLTVEQFISLLKSNTDSKDSNEHTTPDASQQKRYVYGIRGIANLLDCSISTANRIKKKGILDDAIIQQGRSIMVDVEKALELLKENSDI